MSNFKRMVSSILILAMIAASSVFTLHAFAENETTNSVVKLEERDLVVADKLETFGLIDAVDESTLTTYVTRETMVDILIRYLHMEGTSLGSTTSPFIDVKASDARIEQYNILYKAGYISGDDNRRYNPKKNLTYNEAITLVINAMGYKFFATRNGGYPEGYLYTANKYDLLGGLRGNGNNPIPYCDLYLLLERSLKADAVAVRGLTGDDDVVFTLQEGYTVLEELFGIKEIEGVVTGTEDTRLHAYDSSKIGMNQIEIDGVVYDTPDKIFADFLGMRVYAYGKKAADGTYDVVYLEAVERANNEYQISAEDVVRPKTDFSRIYYTDADHKERHLDLVGNSLSVIYNGKNYSNYSKENFRDEMPDSGYIVGLDNNNDKTIDVLFIYEFENYVVGAIDSYSYTFHDKYDNRTVTLDPYEDDVRVYNATRHLINLEEIQVGDLISVMESKPTTDYELITVYITKEKVVGTIDEMRGTDRYVINGQEYRLAQNAIDYINHPDGTKLPSIGLGRTGTFYLDIEGKISHFETDSETTYAYGFVAGVHSEDGNIKNSIALKIYKQDGTWIEAETTDNVNIDGKKYELSSSTGFNAAKRILTQESEVTPGPEGIDGVIGDVILFGMNGDLISYIDTAALNGNNTTQAADAGNLTVVASGAELYQRVGICHKNGNPAAGHFLVKTGACVVFMTPEAGEYLSDVDSYGIDDKLSSYVYSPSGRHGSVMTEGFVAYNLGIDEFNMATCILLRGRKAAGKLGESSALSVITKITTAADAEGTTRTKLYYAENGVEKSALVADSVSYGFGTYNDDTQDSEIVREDLTFDALALLPGDFIRLATDTEGHIYTIDVWYRQPRQDPSAPRANEAWMLDGMGNMNKDNKFAYAHGTFKAYDAKNQILQFSLMQNLAVTDDDGTVEKTYNVDVSKTSYSVCRMMSDGTVKVEAASVMDLVPGDTFVMRTNNYAVRADQIVIIKD